MEVLLIAGITIGSMATMRIAKSPSKIAFKYLKYKLRKKHQKRLLKNAIYERDYDAFFAAINNLKNIDNQYESNNIERIYRIFNINEEIVNSREKFNKFYNVNVYSQLSPEDIQNIVDNYCQENSVSIVDPNSFRLDL